MSDDTVHRCFMDGIDWEHHLGADAKGTSLFPSVKSLKAETPCIDRGGCGVVEVEVRLIRWVEKQDLKYRTVKPMKTTPDRQKRGALKTRSRIANPITGTWTKRDDRTGKFLDVKADPKPFKGVRKEKKK